MKYRNASEILPDELLKEIQKYTSGEAIYIPTPTDKKRKRWGEGSGTRIFYEQRNEEIRYKFSHGATMEQLAGEYFLSVETIRKIVYRL